MKSNYQHIFTPLTVKNMTIKNRIVMMPMGTNYGEQNGEMSFLHINYYKERAKGGTGLIIVENASVDSPQGSNGTTQLRIDHDNYLPRLYKFCEFAIIIGFLQIWYLYCDPDQPRRCFRCFRTYKYAAGFRI